jgi:hypothetical protein
MEAASGLSCEVLRGLRMPSKTENPAPAMKIPNAASSDQEERSRRPA